VRAYGGGPDGAGLVLVEGPPVEVVAGRRDELRWEVPETAGAPVAKVGLSAAGVAGSEVTIRAVDWGGTPRVTFALPDGIRSDRNLPNNPWSAMFMNGVSRFHARPGCSFNIMQDRGRGILHTGAEDWRDLSVEAVVRPFLAAEFGLAVRVQGLRRYYALLLGRDGKARLVRNCQTDTTLATAPFSWTERDEIDLRLVVEGRRLRGIVNGRALVEAEDRLGGLDGGGVGFVVSEGRIEADYLRVGPAA
jgi:hypothetical protein